MNKDKDNFLSVLKNKIADVNQHTFDSLALEVYNYQQKNNSVFKEFVCQLGSFQSEFVFLPVSAFKSHIVKSGRWDSTLFFESSGTGSGLQSRHYARDINWYLVNALEIFQASFGNISDFCVLALLPNYIEKGNSSLVAMVDYFIQKSNNKSSGFYLYDHDALAKQLIYNEENGIRTLLFGVSFALLDFVSQLAPRHYANLVVMETGGMKGRRHEITRDQLHKELSIGFQHATISSEYGMTELYSQAYMDKDGWFYPGKTMKVFISEINDPLTMERVGKAGVINIVDLANIDTCSFITTEDIGVLNDNGGFKVLGRLDNSDLRGCNLLVSG